MPHYICQRCKNNFFREQVYLMLCQNCLGQMNIDLPISLGPYTNEEILEWMDKPKAQDAELLHPQ